ncbi:hypothetical protein VCHC81A2_2878, partial [Vibrio cholerae HC-81A2]
MGGTPCCLALLSKLVTHSP